MRYLIDTQIILWALVDDQRIRPYKDTLKDPRNDIFFSSATIWEIAIKHAKGALTFSPKEVLDACLTQLYTEIEITSEHAAATADLSYPKNLPQHKDPFDRILIAQAKCEGMILLTADSKILKYNEPCIMR